jgi:hypothetical protein
MNTTSETADDGTVKHDRVQFLTERERSRARTNIRALKAPDYTQARLYGLDITIGGGSSGSGTSGGEPHILLAKTASGHWSSDGNEVAPAVGPWLMLTRVTESVTEYDDYTEEGDGIGDAVTVDVVSWEMTYYVDEVLQSLSWKSEAATEMDLFEAMAWQPDPPDDEVQETVRIEPVEPDLTPPRGYLFADLPDGVVGMRGWVTDSNLPALGNFGEPVDGGGSDTVPVFFDGTTWIIA